LTRRVDAEILSGRPEEEGSSFRFVVDDQVGSVADAAMGREP